MFEITPTIVEGFGRPERGLKCPGSGLEYQVKGHGRYMGARMTMKESNESGDGIGGQRKVY